MSNRLFLTVMVIGFIIITACVSAAATIMLTKPAPDTRLAEAGTVIAHQQRLLNRAHSDNLTLSYERRKALTHARRLSRAVRETEAYNRQLESALHLSKQRKVYSNAELESLLALSLWPRDRWSFVTRRTPCESTNQPHVTNGPYTGLMQFRVGQLGATRAELLRPIENLDYSYRWAQMVGAGAWECGG